MGSFHVIELNGSPYDIGYKHGSECKHLISDLIENNYKSIECLCEEKCFMSLPREKFLDVGIKHLHYVKEYAPDLVEEVRGIADGAQTSFEEVFCLNCTLEMIELAYPELVNQLLFGCTVFAASGEMTASDDVFVGENIDLRSIFQVPAVILKIEPEIGPSSVIATVAGIIGLAGQNSAGISLCVNKVHSIDSRFGVPSGFITRSILQKQRIGDSIAAITSARRASGYNYLLGDANGDIYDIETTATDYEVTYADKGYIGHANNYLTQRLIPYEAERPQLSDTFVRVNRANKYLRNKNGEITIKDLEYLAKDHVNYPTSICRHLNEKPSESEQLITPKTITSIIMQPKNSKVFACIGNPCQTQYEEYVV